MRKKLYLSTETFPYGRGEKTFILPELDELCKHFDVIILSHASQEILDDVANKTVLGKEIRVINIDIILQWYKKIKYFFLFFLDKDGICEIKSIVKSKTQIFSRLYQAIGFYALAEENLRQMKEKDIFRDIDNSIFYSYWYFYYTYSIKKMKKKYPNIKAVTRTHGFDLYDERYKAGRQPFKKIMDRRLDKIFFIAQQGKDYYLEKYLLKDDAKKYIVSRLGTIKRLSGNQEEKRENFGRFRLVSCSSIIPIKRVELIVQALGLLKEPIEWVHFGTGIEYEKVEKLSKKVLGEKKNITYIMKGYVTNDKILDYYQENFVDCFISTSSSEGIPVSIQEAMSFGIPVIATSVGGVPELFSHNGILLEKNPTKEDVAQAIQNIINMTEKEYFLLRKNSFRIWAERYDATKNSKNFVNMLKEI